MPRDIKAGHFVKWLCRPEVLNCTIFSSHLEFDQTHFWDFEVNVTYGSQDSWKTWNPSGIRQVLLEHLGNQEFTREKKNALNLES